MKLMLLTFSRRRSGPFSFPQVRRLPPPWWSASIIALFQALTQVQEATLTFVPKIVAVLVTIGISAPFVGSQISIFTNLVFSRIQSRLLSHLRASFAI